MAQWLTERLGQPFIIENRPGGGTNLATEAVVRAPPDGYTLLNVTTSNAINASLYDTLKYDLMRDIAPVASMIYVPIVMVVIQRFQPKPFPSSSPMPKPIRASSIWHQQATATSAICQASCSR